MSMSSQERPPVVTVTGGFLRSVENQVATIRALGFDLQIKIFQPAAPHSQLPLLILVENIRGSDVVIEPQGGVVSNLIRSPTAVMFEVTGGSFRKIRITDPAPAEEFDFLLVGDTHGVVDNLQRVIAAANLLSPRFILANGDLTHSGRAEDYQTLTELFGAAHVPVFTSIGNHDKRSRGSRATYRKHLAPLYYAFECGNVKFIVLDSSRKRGLQKFQYAWLERELRAAQGKRIFVCLHRPPVCPKYNYLAFSVTANAKRFLTMMETYGVELVLNSHIHVLTEFVRQNVRYVVTGGGGGALWRPENIHHYLHVFVKKAGVEFEVLELPTPDAKISQRLKDAIKFNVEFHLNKTKRLRQAVLLGTTLLLSRTLRPERRQRWRRKK